MSSPFHQQGPGDVARQVRTLLTDQLGLEPGRLDGDDFEAVRLEDLGADSLDAIEVIMALEERFDIEISDDEAEAAFAGGEGTVGALVKLAEAGVQRRGAAVATLKTPLEKLPLSVWREQFRAELTAARDSAVAAAERWTVRRDVLREASPDTWSGRAALADRADGLAKVFTELARSQDEQLAELSQVEAEEVAA